MHDATVADQPVVGCAEGLLSSHSTDPRADDANNDGREGAGTGITQDTEPRQIWVGAHLGGTIDDPGTHTGGEKGEGDRPSITAVAGSEEKVGSASGVESDATSHLAGGAGARRDGSFRLKGRQGRCHAA